MFLLVPAYPGCPGSEAVKRSLLLYLLCLYACMFMCFVNETLNIGILWIKLMSLIKWIFHCTVH